MESSAAASSGIFLPPEPLDSDLDMVFPMDSPVPPVPPKPPPVLHLKFTLYLRWSPLVMDLNPRPLVDPPYPPDRASPSQSKTFTIITKHSFLHLELALADPKNHLILLVSHSSWPSSCDVVNFFVSTILKPRTLEVIVVSFGLKRPLEDPCFQPQQTYLLSQLAQILVSDVGGNPLRRPFLSYLFVNLVFDVSGNPLLRPALSYLFINLASDVGGSPLRRPVLSDQKLVRLCCRPTTLTSSAVGESISLPCLLSMNGENLLDSCSSFSFSLLTGLLPCEAVCTGLEGAIEITPIFFVGGDCLSTSLVTISQLSDFVVKALLTYSHLVLNSLSTSYEDLSCLFLLVNVVMNLYSGGC